VKLQRCGLGELEIDGLQQCVQLRLPNLEHLVKLQCCGLGDGDAILAFLICERELIEALVDGSLLHGEAVPDLLTNLLQLIDHHLDVGIHSTKLLLSAIEVVVIF
jgi:hypothetical protein